MELLKEFLKSLTKNYLLVKKKISIFIIRTFLSKKEINKDTYFVVLSLKFIYVIKWRNWISKEFKIQIFTEPAKSTYKYQSFEHFLSKNFYLLSILNLNILKIYSHNALLWKLFQFYGVSVKLQTLLSNIRWKLLMKNNKM